MIWCEIFNPSGCVF